ncbi:MAG: hypothetical protein NTX25_22495 [Proteobacteria bacterium]|jgi:hypothetical protein|nr:hypothetical protein [Pseudomonadota bacterium]
MPSSKRKSRGSEDDVVGLAGWLFTDLMLGLVIIFLATASFQVFGNTGNDTCVEYEKTYFPTPLREKFTERTAAAAEIKNKMDAFGKKNELENYQVAVSLIYGSYDKGSETAGDGQRFAHSFYMDSLQRAEPDFFPSVLGAGLNDTEDFNVRFFGSPPDERVPSQGIYVELYFIYDTCAIKAAI